jgi:hypothetical protein
MEHFQKTLLFSLLIALAQSECIKKDKILHCFEADLPNLQFQQFEGVDVLR